MDKRAEGLSVIIPARNEMFLKKTIESALDAFEGDSEVIAICDGYWPDPPILDNKRVVIVHFTEPVGQRAATNYGAMMSRAKFIMKADGHCNFEKGFDVKLMSECDYDWTVVPRLYNLHAFDWVCMKCGWAQYQGPKPEKCEVEGCDGKIEMVIRWEPRWNRKSDFSRFDETMHFQYWRAYGKRPEAQGDISDLMCHVGACWMMHRQRYWDLDGSDETHGSWGQMGVEISCKTWLSGGRQVVNKKTWYSHMFRTQKGFGFPYRISWQEQENARIYSRDLWMNNKWPKQTRKLEWILEKFFPIPGWHPAEAGDGKQKERRRENPKDAIAVPEVGGMNG